MPLVKSRARGILGGMASRILVVEDETTIGDSVDIALRQAGFIVLRAQSLSEARRHLKAQPDVMVLDIGLPDGSGLDLCRELQNRPGPRIIFLSAHSSDIDRIVGLEIGADDYLTKPFSPRELVARVRAILRRPASLGAAAATGSGLEIDAVSRRAFIRGQGVELPRLQLRILEVLAAEPGRVFSRSQLMDLAWDHPEEALDRAVDSQVRHLRSALRLACPQGDPIRTVRGEGYALDEHWPPVP
jgi:two-component system catabolic regulation response regulator CreB